MNWVFGQSFFLSISTVTNNETLCMTFAIGCRALVMCRQSRGHLSGCFWEMAEDGELVARVKVLLQSGKRRRLLTTAGLSISLQSTSMWLVRRKGGDLGPGIISIKVCLKNTMRTYGSQQRSRYIKATTNIKQASWRRPSADGPRCCRQKSSCCRRGPGWRWRRRPTRPSSRPG